MTVFQALITIGLCVGRDNADPVSALYPVPGE